MKVLAISNLYPPDIVGGYEVTCAQTVDWLRARGHDVGVLTSTSRGTPVAAQAHVLRRFELADLWNQSANAMEGRHARALRWSRAAHVNAHNVQELLAAVEEDPPEVIHMWNVLGLGGAAIAVAVQQLGVPCVWHLGDVVPSYITSDEWEPIPALAGALSRHLRDITCVAVSRHVFDEIEDSGVALDGDRHIVPNWLTPPHPPLQRSWHTPGRTLRCVTTGTLHRWKGTDVALDTIARLHEASAADVTLDVYGDDTLGEFAQLANDLGVADVVQFRGFRPHAEITAMYRDYDVFLFPTASREPFGIAAMEAAASGCVPLVTDNCGYAEWFVAGVHCLKAQATAEHFAAALLPFLRGESSLESIGRRAAAVVRRDFDADVVLPRIESILTVAAQQPHRPAKRASDLQRLAVYAELLALRLVEERTA